MERWQRWWDRGNCSGVDPETFYPDPTDTEAIERAVEICLNCPVMLQCREDGLRNQPISRVFTDRGIYGAMTPAEQRDELRKRGQKPNRRPGFTSVPRNGSSKTTV